MSPQITPEETASALKWVVADSDELLEGVESYLTEHGLAAFLQEYYNIIGTRPEAVFIPENRAVARALGLAVESEALPLVVERQAVHRLLYWPKVVLDRRYLARYFAEPSHLRGLTAFQRLFLEWHFLAPVNYSWTLLREGGQVLVGWNDLGELAGRDDFAMYTNVMGCTAVFALAPDGAAHLSHYDDDNINPAQIVALMDFLRRHPGAEVSALGVNAAIFARKLAAERGVRAGRVHVKREYRTTAYWARFTRRRGTLRSAHCVMPVTEEYIRSTHYTEYGRWFIYGQFGMTFPPADESFTDTVYEPFPG